MYAQSEIVPPGITTVLGDRYENTNKTEKQYGHETMDKILGEEARHAAKGHTLVLTFYFAVRED